MIRKIKRKRKNPKLKYEMEDILARFYPNSDDIKITYINKGYYAHAFKLVLNSRKLSDNTILDSGTYVIKILLEKSLDDEDDAWKPLTTKTIDRLKLLSKYGLIPKIYYIDKYIIIMKYISGDSLKDLISSGDLKYKDFMNIMKKARDLKSKWEDLGFIHGDLHEGNMILSNNKLYFIDPKYEARRVGNDEQFLDDLENDRYVLDKLI